ncbi:RNA 2',3'-cyclic phosphodiesterase [Desulfocicer niacini]
MRTFIAIPIPEEILVFLCGIQNQIRHNALKASWIKSTSMHLTLRFFGDTEQDDIKAIIRAMDSTAVGCRPFSLSARGLGVFPGVKKPKVIWSGVKGQVDQLQELKKKLETNLVNVGLKKDKSRFSPHFTIGRFKGAVNSRTVINDILIFQNHTSKECMIRSMVLYKSDLKPSGAVHTPLFESLLSGMDSR